MAATLRVILPEETFQPRELSARVSNVSPRGMRLTVEDLDFDLYRRMMTGRRFARIEMADPEETERIKVSGTIVWLEFHGTGESKIPGICDVGLEFDKSTTANLGDYEKFLRRHKFI